MYFYRIFLLYFIFTLVSTISFYSYEKYIDFDLIKEVEKPRFIKNGILFTLSGEDGKKAFLRTNLDNWEKNHYFNSSLYGVLYVFISHNLKSSTRLKYKINIDGFWEIDLNNPDYVEDMLGTKLSVISIPDKEVYHLQMPIIEKTENKIKKVAFKYYNPIAKEVNFVCSVDNFCQYSHPMQKNKNGDWKISLEFSKGVYLYFFFVDGNKRIDSENSNKMWNEKKGFISYFVIE